MSMLVPSSCRLRPVDAGDARMILEWRNRPHIRAVMFTTVEIDWADHCAWLERTIDSESAHAYIFVQQGRDVGYVKLDALENGRMSWGFYIGEESAPAGSGSRMLYLALEEAFGALGACAVEAVVKTDNVASLRVHAKLGFRNKDVATTRSPAASFEITRDDWFGARAALAGALFAAGEENRI